MKPGFDLVLCPIHLEEEEVLQCAVNEGRGASGLMSGSMIGIVTVRLIFWWCGRRVVVVSFKLH